MRARRAPRLLLKLDLALERNTLGISKKEAADMGGVATAMRKEGRRDQRMVGYEQTTAASYERTGGGYGAEVRTEGRTAGVEYYSETKAHESSYGAGSYGGQKETGSEEEARNKAEEMEKEKEKGKKKEKKHKEYGYGEEGREYGEESEEEEEGYKESRGFG
ncbi:MAG: hypothetical protein M1839_005906 [Geoglossum umbratile]|nr:MAG: hypothetical protein M1839_005906 [Geoglossum umbratile]